MPVLLSTFQTYPCFISVTAQCAPDVIQSMCADLGQTWCHTVCRLRFERGLVGILHDADSL
jgi:hypothetical protein